MRVKRNFHRIWIAMKKPLVKRGPCRLCYLKLHDGWGPWPAATQRFDLIMTLLHQLFAMHSRRQIYWRWSFMYWSQPTEFSDDLSENGHRAKVRWQPVEAAINSLSPGKCGCDFKCVNFEHNMTIEILSIHVTTPPPPTHHHHHPPTHPPPPPPPPTHPPHPRAYMRRWTGLALVQVMACRLPIRRQAITWTNADLLSIGHLGTIFRVKFE